MNRILQFLVGTRDSIQRGTVSGIVGNVCFAILLFVYIFLFDRNLSSSLMPAGLSAVFGNLGLCYVLGLLSLAFVVMGGRAIGWLFIRPIAALLHYLLPGRDFRLVWVLSSVLVWVLVVGLAVSELPAQSKGITFLLILILAVISGAVGGFVGGRAQTTGKVERNEIVALAGNITGSTLVILWLFLPSGLAIKATNLPGISRETIFLIYGYLVLISFFAILPYAWLIWPIGRLLERFRPFREKRTSLWMGVGGIIWLALAAVLFPLPGEVMQSGTWWFSVLVLTMSGMLGGWTINEFKDNL